MGTVINLRLARKARARTAKAADAAGNAARHGQSKAERKLTETTTDKARRDLDGHALDTRPESQE